MLYYFMYKKIILGGCELVIEKLARQLMHQNNAVEIVCCQIDDAMEKRCSLSEIKVHKVKKWSRYIAKELNSTPDEEVRFITFFWEDFTKFYNCVENAKTILYAVNFMACCVGIEEKKHTQIMFKQLSQKKIYDLLLDGNIVCMDEETVRYTENYYSDKRLDVEIVRVPEDIQPFDTCIIKEKFKKNDFNILTIARAEFPTKGYILGLMEWFKREDIPENVTITIISYGDGINIITQAINSVPEEKRKKINLVGKTDYNELKKYFAAAKLYVGMGTTILDAAQTGTISIAVKPFTYDLFAVCTFEQDYTNIGINDNIDLDNQFHELFQKVLSYSEEEYLESAIKGRSAVVEHYSSEKIATQLKNKFDMISKDKADDTINFFQEYYRQQDEALSLCLMMNQWVKIKQMKKSLAAYLKQKGYYEIAVYGMNYIGETLVSELKEGDIKIKYGIDMRADDICTEIKMVKPSDNLDDVDAVIVAAIKFFDEVKESLCTKVNCPIISLERILFDV